MSAPTLTDTVKAVRFYDQITRRTSFTNRTAETVLMDMTGCSARQADRALYRAAARDLIEFGVSPRTGWLTDRGRRFLETGVIPPDHSVLDGLPSLRAHA